MLGGLSVKRFVGHGALGATPENRFHPMSEATFYNYGTLMLGFRQHLKGAWLLNRMTF